jgi:hypothetical protein
MNQEESSMQADFCKEAFNIDGKVWVKMHDGREFNTQFPKVVWRWLDGKDWASVSVWCNDLDQCYGWDRS